MTRDAAAQVDRVELGAASQPHPDFPGLTRIAAKTMRGLIDMIAQTGGATQVSAGTRTTSSFGAWKAGLASHTRAARYREPALKGGVLVTVPGPLIATLVDVFYGGGGAIPAGRQSSGVAEQRLFDRLAARTGQILTQAWGQTHQLAPTLVETAFAAHDIRLGKDSDIVVVQSFDTSDPHAGEGAIEIVYPMAGLRGLAGLQAPCEASAQDLDPAWQTRLSDAVMNSRLPVRTVIARPSVPLSTLMGLTPGDFIPLTLPAKVPVTVAGRLLAHGTIGQANGRAAIRIEKLEEGAYND